MSGPQQRPKRIGRPPKPEAEAKRHPIGIRTTKDLKDRIEAAAAAAGRSVAQEVEYRLERSFSFDDTLGVSALLRFFQAVKVETDNIKEIMGRDWMTDYEAWHAMRRLLPLIVNQMRPIPPNATGIMAAMEVERTAKDKLVATMAAPPAEGFDKDAAIEEARIAHHQAKASLEEAFAEMDRQQDSGAAKAQQIIELREIVRAPAVGGGKTILPR